MGMRIAICDDECILSDMLRQKVEKELDARDVDAEIHQYVCGEDLLRDNENQMFDVVFLDILMPEMDGETVACKLREVTQEQFIIFVSYYERYVFSSQVYFPFRFLRRAYLDKELPRTITDMLRAYAEMHEKVIIDCENEVYVFRIRDIWFCEVYGHKVIVHTRQGEQHLRFAFHKLEKKLQDCGFVRTHKSYLVNLAYVNYIGKKGVEVEGVPDVLPLSRYRAKDVRRRLLLYGMDKPWL